MRFRASRTGRASRLTVLAALLAVTLAACGGGSSAPTGPTPTAAPMATVAPTSPPASPVAAVSPVTGDWTRSIDRETARARILDAYPMETPGKTGGTLVLGSSGDISTVNPILANDTATALIVGSIYETLVAGSPIDGQPIPGLADAWDVSPDGLTYRFHLNRDARWHDGVDVTADDVAFSFDAALDPNTGASYTSLIRENVASYRVIDADTFEVVAADRFVSFLFNGPGAVYIMPKHIWGETGYESWSFDGGSTGESPERVIGSGPFKFGEWVQGDHVTLVRNDDYWDTVPTIEEFVLRVLPDTDTAVLALENGETDILEIIPAPDTRRVQETPGLKVEIYDIFSMTMYAMNLDPEKSPYFSDVATRQAMLTAIDRESITENIFLGYGEAAVGVQPGLSPAYAPDRMQPFPFDVEVARALLAEAGWTDSNGDGVLDRNGEKFRFELLYSDGDATTRQIVSYLQEAWKAVGIEVELTSLDFTTLVDRLKKHDFDMALIGFNLGADGSQTSLFGCDQYDGGLNFMRYCNPEWDALDEQQKREFDPAARTELLIQQSQIVWQEQPVGVFRFGIARTGYNEAVRNFHPNGYGFLWSLPYIWLDR